MMKAPSGICRSMGSRASLVSLSSSSSISCTSSERASSFGERSRFSSSFLALSSVAANRQQAPGLSREDNIPWAKQQEPKLKAPTEEGNSLLYTFFSVICFRITRHVLRVLDFIRPDTFYNLDIIRSMILCYRDEYRLKQRLAAFAMASTVSLSFMGGELREVMGSGGSSRGTFQGVAGMVSCYSSEEFHPKAKLITAQSTDDGCDIGHWGHFADFDCIEDDDIPFLSGRLQLETLDEHEDEDE